MVSWVKENDAVFHHSKFPNNIQYSTCLCIKAMQGMIKQKSTSLNSNWHLRILRLEIIFPLSHYWTLTITLAHAEHYLQLTCSFLLLGVFSVCFPSTLTQMEIVSQNTTVGGRGAEGGREGNNHNGNQASGFFWFCSSMFCGKLSLPKN